MKKKRKPVAEDDDQNQIRIGDLLPLMFEDEDHAEPPAPTRSDAGSREMLTEMGRKLKQAKSRRK
jgi:hypothetical protein